MRNNDYGYQDGLEMKMVSKEKCDIYMVVWGFMDLNYGYEDFTYNT